LWVFYYELQALKRGKFTFKANGISIPVG